MSDRQQPGLPRGKTVLYVEDMVENFRPVEQILRQRPSVTLLPAMLADVALDLARQQLPHLILLDLRLPDMPGVRKCCTGCAPTRGPGTSPSSSSARTQPGSASTSSARTVAATPPP